MSGRIKRIQDSWTVETGAKSRIHILRDRGGVGRGVRGVVVTRLGYVEVSAYDVAKPSSSYRAVIDGREYSMWEQGIARTPIGLARVAHRWIRAIKEKP